MNKTERNDKDIRFLKVFLIVGIVGLPIYLLLVSTTVSWKDLAIAPLALMLAAWPILKWIIVVYVVYRAAKDLLNFIVEKTADRVAEKERAKDEERSRDLA